MLRKATAIATLICVIAALPGCYSKHELTPKGLLEDPEYRIESVVTVDGRTIEFEKDGRRALVFEGDIVGFNLSGKPVRIPLSEVRSISVVKFHGGRTAVTILLLSAVTVTALVLKWKGDVNEAWQDGYNAGSDSESCPFLYSFDGSRFVFDGEPYGGAICEGLKRSDLCELEHLREVDGEYRLMLSNELDETQFTDQLELLVVDHPMNVRVIPDEQGGLHTVGLLEAPLSARDNRGNDWRKWLAGSDELFWESDLASRDPERASDLRDTLVLALRRPHEATSAKLVVSARNSVLSSQVLRDGTALRGDRIDEWYEALRMPAVREAYYRFFAREEVGILQVRVQVDGRWESRAEFDGCSPLVFEDRVVPIDLEGVQGDTLWIMLAPPAGFWELNRFAVDYTSDVGIEVTTVAAESAVSDDGRDLSLELASTDGRYFVMEDIGRSASLTFAAPAPAPECARTVFARVSGYYKMHIDACGAPQTDLLERLEFEPGYAVRFALAKHSEWRDSMIAGGAE